MTIRDITIPLQEGMPVWPGDPAFRRDRIMQISRGDEANVSHLSLASHTGTHIDAPYHFLEYGATLDNLALETLVGPADVAYFPSQEAIDAADLEAAGVPQDCVRLLLRTRNSRYWAQAGQEFRRDYVGITEAAARWIVDRGIRLVGIDYLGIHRFGNARPVHEILLGARVIILEGLNLTDIAPGRYQLACLPLKIAGGDGAPVRAILIE